MLSMQEAMQNIGVFYNDIYGSHECVSLPGLELSCSGSDLFSLNMVVIHDKEAENSILRIRDYWKGPFSLIIDTTLQDLFVRQFSMLGVKQVSRHPMLCKYISDEDMAHLEKIYGKYEDIVFEKIKTQKSLRRFMKISSDIYQIDNEMALSAMHEDVLDSETTDIFGAFYEETPVGTVSSLHNETSSFIWNMAIKEEYRKNTYFLDIAAHFFRHCYKNQRKTIFTYTTAKESESAFKKIGAEEIGQIALFYCE
jgi:hypothetical protein